MISEIIYKSGDFTYRFHNDWGKLPGEIKGSVVRGIIQGKNGLFYVAVQAEPYPIAVLDQDGNFIKGICHELKLKHVHGLFAEDDGTIRFCDDLSNLIYHIDEEGNILDTMGDYNQFSNSGCDHSLPLQESLDSIIRLAPPFNRPTRMIKAENGDLFVTDGYGNAAVHRFDHDGKLIKTWGGPGAEPGHFRLPHSLWEDVQGRIWVVDRENNRVQVFNKDGDFILLFDKLHTPTDIWGDKNNIYVSENRAGLIIFDMELRIVARLGYATAEFNGCPIGSHSICGDAAGNIYLGEIRTENPVMKLERI